MTLPLTPAQSSALSALCAGLAGTRLVLIGAAALGYHVPLSRLTADVDLALVVDPARFDALLGPLGWRRDVRVRQRWYGPDDVVADILPASADVLRAGVVRFDDDTREMSVLGFDLALAHASAVSLEGSAVTVDVASLPALVVLKIVSWLDRPSDRAKDLSDLARVLEHALGDDDERRWDPEQPVYASGLEHEDQGAFFVGHALAQIMGAPHREKIEEFLARVGDPDGAGFALMLREARYGGEDPEAKLAASRRFERASRGIRNANAPQVDAQSPRLRPITLPPEARFLRADRHMGYARLPLGSQPNPLVSRSSERRRRVPGFTPTWGFRTGSRRSARGRAVHFARGLSTTSATPARITAIAPTAVHPMRSLPRLTPRITATTGFTNA